MAQKKVWIGSTGPFLFDDSILYIDEEGVIAPDNQQAVATNGQIVVQSPPTSDVHVVRKIELDNIAGTLGLGTMAYQNADNVNIINGVANFAAVRVGWTAQVGYQLVTNCFYAAGLSHFNSGITFGNAPVVRANLGLGTIAIQNADNVNITNGVANFATAQVGWSAQPGYQLTVNTQWNAGLTHFNSAVSFGDPSSTRGNLGLGNMSLQNNSVVNITGGSIVGLTRMFADGASTDRCNVFSKGFICHDYTPPGGDPVGLFSNISDGANRYNLFVGGAAPSFFAGKIGVGLPAVAPNVVHIFYDKNSSYGLAIQAQVADGGPGVPITFLNTGGTTVGYINTSATNTSYNTSSDARLKHAIEKLVGSLDIIRTLNPISFLWNADDSQGEGFLAHELQQSIPTAVTGEPDALDDAGNVFPQGVDYSKLVPRLVGAIQELLTKVENLTARVATLEAA